MKKEIHTEKHFARNLAQRFSNRFPIYSKKNREGFPFLNEFI